MIWPSSCCRMTDTQRRLCTHPDLQLAILLLASCCQRVQSHRGLRLQLHCPVLHHHVHDAPLMDVGVKLGAPRRVHRRLLLLVHLALFFERNLRHLVIAGFFESGNFSLHQTGNRWKQNSVDRFTLTPQYLNHVIITGRVEVVMSSMWRLILRFPHLELETNPMMTGSQWGASYGYYWWWLALILFVKFVLRHLQTDTDIMRPAWSGSPEELSVCDDLLPLTNTCRPGFNLFYGIFVLL